LNSKPTTVNRIVLFDDEYREQFLPLSWTRPVADFRIGIFTIREKWEKRLNAASTTATVDYLRNYNFPFEVNAADTQLWINGRVLPTAELVSEVLALETGDALIKGELLIAVNNGNSIEKLNAYSKDHLTGDFALKQSKAGPIVLRRVHDIFTHNGRAITEDLELISQSKCGKPSTTNTVVGSYPVLMEAGAIAEACIFNTTKGPIYIGAGAEVMEGAMLRGPLAIGAGAQVKMGAKLYGDTTIGPGCKVGGEITNSIFFANSNKAHDGYIGNSVIGEWCNLGADTNCSNLKNNYGEISVWNYAIGGDENTGLQFHGLIMGDHAKCGINTMLNTGTVIGLAANIFGGGFPEKMVPDFSWGGKDGMTEYRIEKAVETIERVYARRNKKLEVEELTMLKFVFEKTAKFRN
jgi:UDP-N-acetylglucosamine diphosphorylase/glucosamine-1-phosphate N-acetyltransferase